MHPSPCAFSAWGWMEGASCLSQNDVTLLSLVFLPALSILAAVTHFSCVLLCWLEMTEKNALTLACVLRTELRHKFLYRKFPREGSCLLPLVPISRAASSLLLTCCWEGWSRVSQQLHFPLEREIQGRNFCADWVDSFHLGSNKVCLLENEIPLQRELG